MQTCKKLPLLLGLFIILPLLSKAQCLSSWAYYMPIVVTNNSSSSLTDFQVKITVNTAAPISNSKMNSSGDDIRFLDSGSCQPLSYWIESGINTSNTTIWVKLPKLPGSAHRTIKMFYGNSSASAMSNGDSTFMLFDDFNGSGLDTKKWTAYGQSGTCTVSSGLLKLSTPSSGRYYGETVISNSSFSGPFIVEDYLSSINNYWNGLAILNSGTYNGYSCFSGTTSGTNTMNLGAVNHNYSAFGAAKTYSSSSTSSLTGIWQMSWPVNGTQNVSWPGGTLSGTSTAVSPGSSFQIGAGMLTESNGDVSIDWIRIRKYAPKEATASAGSESLNGYIIVSAISGSPFCSSSASSLTIPFTIFGNAAFNSGNVFTAQLSDSSGSFTNPVTIGTLTSTSGGSISATVPSGAYGIHYRVRILNTSNSAYNSAPSSTVLTFAPPAFPSFSVNNATQCFKNNSFTFTNSTTGTGTFTYSWIFGDGGSSGISSPTYNYLAPGTYTVDLITTNIAGCSDTAYKTVNILSSLPVFSVNTAGQCFSTNSFVFTNKSTGNGTLTYKWDFGDGKTSNTASPAYSYTSAGTFKVKLYSTSNNTCTDSSETTIIVYPKVLAGFKINDAAQCINQQNFIFTNSSSVSAGSLAYQWNYGDGSSFGTNTNTSHNYQAPGAYTVRLTATSDKGCVDTTSKSVTIIDLPAASIKAQSETSFCQGSSVNLAANTGSGLTYQWIKDGIRINTATSQIYSANSTGNYKVVVFNSNLCSDTSQAIKITVFPTPAKPAITQNGRNLISSKAPAYQWNQDGKSIAGETSSSYFPTSNKGDYSVTITDSNGCSNTSDTYHYDVTAISLSFEQVYVKLYPSPAHSILNLDINGEITHLQSIEIIDNTGRSVYQIQNPVQNHIAVNTEALKAGLYIIKLSGGGNTLLQKIVIE